MSCKEVLFIIEFFGDFRFFFMEFILNECSIFFLRIFSEYNFFFFIMLLLSFILLYSIYKKIFFVLVLVEFIKVVINEVDIKYLEILEREIRVYK